MYLYIVVQERESYYTNGPEGRVKARLEEASSECCLVVPYQEFDMRVVDELKPRAIAMSGFGGHFQQREVQWFWGMDEVLHQAEVPIICFCGSHQVLGFAFNRDLRRTERLYDEPMRRIGPEEDLPRRPRQSPEVDLSSFYMADGFFPIWRVKDDPLFRDLPEVMTMHCAHYCEVKQLPPGFELLARSGHCAIEAMRHTSRPLYGTQFHPEHYEAPSFDGRTLLGNFAQIVRDFWANKG